LFLKPKGRRWPIALLILSCLWLTATFGPLLYSAILPNDGVKALVDGLREPETAPPESAPVVQQVVAAAGILKRTVPVGYYSGVTATVRLNGVSQTTRVRQAIYLAWFEKLPKPVLIGMTQYESDGVRRYEIAEVESATIVRGYSFPLLGFGIALYLVVRRKPQDVAAT
jgi:hypothetical protein